MLRLSVFVCGLWICVAHCTPIADKLYLPKDEDSSFDWRTEGVISPVQNQGMIGSVLAFVLTEEVESLHAIQTGKPVVRLSVEEVADCCDVHIVSGFECVVRIGGLCTEAMYKKGMGKCNNDTCVAVGKVTGTRHIQEGREDFMLLAIHLVPLAVLVDASRLSFQEYSSGIYSDTSCSSTQLDHSLQLVGYGQEGGVDYWIAKNSWGANWGENGYIRILRGKNMCGIASMAFYPVNQQ